MDSVQCMRYHKIKCDLYVSVWPPNFSIFFSTYHMHTKVVTFTANDLASGGDNDGLSNVKVELCYEKEHAKGEGYYFHNEAVFLCYPT